MAQSHKTRGDTDAQLPNALRRVRRGLATVKLAAVDRPPVDDLTPALLDAVALFESLHIDYALIGGLAAMCYGRARFTEDVDFIAAEGHMEVLTANPDAMRRHHFDPSSTWKLCHESGLQVDLWKDAHVPEMLGRARSFAIAGRSVRVVDPHDLIAMKLRANRPQDDYDISEIVKTTAVDEALIRQRVTAEEMERYAAIKRRIGAA